jgi:hypothetical protein
MSTKPRVCPKCQGEMVQGFAVDHGFLNTGVGTWVEGPPEKEVPFGTKIPEECIPIGTFRCAACGYLESYARAEFAAEVSIPGRAEEPPPPWTVCISERQETKTEMRMVQELLLKHGIPARAAYNAASQFRGGVRVVVPVRNAEAGRALVNGLQGFRLAAEVAEPQAAEGTGPPS